MSRSLRLHPAAQRELDEAAAYYDAESPGLGSAFLSELDHALQQIRAFPEAAPVGGLSGVTDLGACTLQGSSLSCLVERGRPPATPTASRSPATLQSWRSPSSRRAGASLLAPWPSGSPHRHGQSDAPSPAVVLAAMLSFMPNKRIKLTRQSVAPDM